MKIISKFYPHALAIFGFVFVSLLYFYPVLQGKQIFQSDIAQYTGMAKEQNDFRASDHVEPYWTDAAFGGMPTYQLGAKYPHDYIGVLDDVLRFLPRPADYLFLYFLGFYGFLLVLKIDPLKAFFGAIAFGFSTYLIIILGVGHNAKAHAIGYMPLVVAGFLLVYQKKYIVGGLLTLFATALEINANHFQMTYYLLVLLLTISAYFTYLALQEKQTKSLLTSYGVLALAGLLAIGANATNLLATTEYASFSTRSKSELSFNPDGSANTNSSALTKDYITEYSYGVAESLNLVVPRLFGGSNNETVGADSNMYQFMITQGVPENQALDFVNGMPTYWGDQPIVAAPAYIGVVVFFFAILALFIDERKIKYAFLSAAIVSLLLSWGKNFPILTDFCIEYVPMYNKFRAVSSIQVILELCLPVLAIMGLQSFFKLEKEQQLKGLKQTAIVSFGLIIILFVIKSFFSFSGGNDAYYMESYGPDFVAALVSDRKTLYSADLLRSGFLVLSISGFLFLFLKNKLAQNTTIILIAVFMVADLFFVAKRYVSAKDFVSGMEVAVPFQETASDTQIKKDTTHYRVFEVNGGFSSARTSYFHNSIGGYHAAKPRRMQQLIDYQISKNNIEILNMLNVKYVIQSDSTGVSFPRQNPNACGNAWFVRDLKLVNKPDDEMKALNDFDPKIAAIFNFHEHGSKYKNVRLKKNLDTTGTIQLNVYKPNYLKYTAETTKEALAVFSEIYYEKGWNAYLNGQLTTHFPVDYVLRAMAVPPGKHTIEFKFEPQVIKTGSTITLISSILIFILLVAGIYFERKNILNQKSN